ncbi:MAG: helicase-related protein [Xanthobacteraceae bacterium]
MMSGLSHLNVALYRNIPKAKQVFMAGPHITSISLGPRWSCVFRFIQTDYRTVSVNLIDRTGSEGHLSAFLADLRSVGEEASLVFTAHPGSASDLTVALLEAALTYRSVDSEKLGDWIGKNYHPDWILSKAVREGIAAHHGRIPRSLGQMFVREFDRGVLKVLICTSTLIEGVNTSASNVFLYDKKINRTDFDFFSFANIRGRVGRMMRHFVGRAFFYHQPPAQVATAVDVPVLSDPSNTSDYILLNVDENDLNREAKERVDEIVERSSLPKAILARYGSLGLERLLQTDAKIIHAVERDSSLLVWTAYPTRQQRIFFSDIILRIFVYPRQLQVGARTAPTLSWCLHQLSRSRSIASFLRWFVRTFQRQDSFEIVLDRAFQFLSGCDFTFPNVIGAIESLAKHHLPAENINYGVYIARLENSFRPAWMKAADEFGIPLPLAERLAPYVPEDSSIDNAVGRLRHAFRHGIDGLDEVDQRILAGALFH